MQSLALEISDDHLRLTISPADRQIRRLELEAFDLDTFIRRLTECRSSMLPVHPAEPPAAPDRLYRTDNLLLNVSACETPPAIQIAMQHPGLGLDRNHVVTRSGRRPSKRDRFCAAGYSARLDTARRSGVIVRSARQRRGRDYPR